MAALHCPTAGWTAEPTEVLTAVLEERGSASSAATRHVARVEPPREPSRASLREMAEVNFDTAKVRRNPYAQHVAAEGIDQIEIAVRGLLAAS